MEKSPSKSKFQCKVLTQNPILRKSVTFIILMILISGIYGAYSVFEKHGSTPEERNSYFTIVLDCGSTGSRVNVFEWVDKNKSASYGDLPVLLHSYPDDNVNSTNGCQYHCMQTKPGLQNFVNNRSQVKNALNPLIRYAEHLVPSKRRYITPIFVLATAGMRMLVAEEAEQVLEDVENVVKEHDFLFKKNWIRILRGEEEAYYGWVALNFKMGIFHNSLKSSTLGILDLGGSSLQVVVEIDDNSVKNTNIVHSIIGPFEHDITAYSLPAFGLNEAFDRTVVMLSHSHQALRESIDGKFEVRHPCLHSNFVENYTCHGCFGLDSSLSRRVSNKGQKNGLNSVLLIGDLSWEQCKLIARAAAVNSSSLELLNHDNPSNCVGLSSNGGNSELNLTKSSRSVRRYHALSGFYAVQHALNLSPNVNLSMMWESGQKLCSADHQTSIGGQRHCFALPYLTSLIENALCLNGTEIVFGPGDVSWTLGASLVEGEFLWHHDGKSQNIFFTLLTFVLLSSLFVTVYCCQIKLPMPSRKIAVT